MMFKFLKDKLKGTISKISEKISSEGKDEVVIPDAATEQAQDIAEEKAAEIPEEKTVKDTEDISEVIEKDKASDRDKDSEEIKPDSPVSEKEPDRIDEDITRKAETEATQEIQTKDTPQTPKEKQISESKKDSSEQEISAEKKEEEISEYHRTEGQQTESISKQETPISEPIIEKQIPEAKPITEKQTTEADSGKQTTETIPEKQPPEPEKKGFFSKLRTAVSTKKIDEGQFEEMFWDMELVLLENNVAVEVIEKIKEDLKSNLIDKPLARGQIEAIIMDTLKSSVSEILDNHDIDLIEKIKTKKPYIICFVGINGSGKTTTIAKVANLLKKEGLTCCLAAADTFRAAAIDQLVIHGNNLGLKVIRQDYGSDPAAVAFDAVKHAEAKQLDAVLIDTAGRIHSNVNLQDEMKKIMRIAKPDMKIFVGESITGNDCVEQAMKFDESIDLDGIILSKADIDEKGGAALSISYVTKKPILYIGTGQEYDDIEKFDRQKMIKNLGL